MSRNFLLAAGAMAWTIVAIDALIHVINGDVATPIGMVVVFAIWFAFRGSLVRGRTPAEARVRVDG